MTRSPLTLLFAFALLAGCKQAPPARSDAPAPIAPHEAASIEDAAVGPVPVVMDTLREDRSRQAEAMLERVQVTWHGEPLPQLIESLRSAEPGLRIVVNWPAIEAANALKDRPLGDVVIKGPASLVLTHALQQLSRDDEKPIAWAISDGVVHISTDDDLARLVETRIYNLPAAFHHPSWRDARHYFPPLNVIGPPTSTGLEGSSIAGPAYQWFDVAGYRLQVMEQLITLIHDTCGDTSQWDVYGGEHAFVREVNGTLVVRASRATHKEVHALLKLIAAAVNRDYLANDEVDALLVRADALRQKQDYKGAMAAVKTALLVQPKNGRARAMALLLEEILSR